MTVEIILVYNFLKKSSISCQILLNFEDFGEALKLLDQASSEGIQPDLLLYNTILQLASEEVINCRQ